MLQQELLQQELRRQELRRQARARVKASLEQAIRNASARDQDAMRLFAADMQALATHVAEARSKASLEIEHLTSIKQSFYLCYLIVRKQLNPYISERMNAAIGTELDTALAGVDTALIRLQQRLESNRTILEFEVASAVEGEMRNDIELEMLEIYAQLQQHLTETIAKETPNIALTKVSASVGIMLSAIFLRSTITTISRVLTKVATTMGSKSALSISLALADGPLPIGDAIAVIIEVGGTTWCAYELYKIQKVLRPDLTAAVDKQIQTYGANLRTTAEKEALRMLKQCETERHVISTKVNGTL